MKNEAVAEPLQDFWPHPRISTVYPPKISSVSQWKEFNVLTEKFCKHKRVSKHADRGHGSDLWWHYSVFAQKPFALR